MIQDQTFTKFSEKIIEISTNRRIVVSTGYYLGSEFLDIRYWIKFPSDNIFKPSKKKGVFLRKSVFLKEILPHIKTVWPEIEKL